MSLCQSSAVSISIEMFVVIISSNEFKPCFDISIIKLENAYITAFVYPKCLSYYITIEKNGDKSGFIDGLNLL